MKRLNSPQDVLGITYIGASDKEQRNMVYSKKNGNDSATHPSFMRPTALLHDVGLCRQRGALPKFDRRVVLCAGHTSHGDIAQRAFRAERHLNGEES